MSRIIFDKLRTFKNLCQQIKHHHNNSSPKASHVKQTVINEILAISCGYHSVFDLQKSISADINVHATNIHDLEIDDFASRPFLDKNKKLYKGQAKSFMKKFTASTIEETQLYRSIISCLKAEDVTTFVSFPYLYGIDDSGSKNLNFDVKNSMEMLSNVIDVLENLTEGNAYFLVGGWSGDIYSAFTSDGLPQFQPGPYTTTFDDFLLQINNIEDYENQENYDNRTELLNAQLESFFQDLKDSEQYWPDHDTGSALHLSMFPRKGALELCFAIKMPDSSQQAQLSDYALAQIAKQELTEFMKSLGYYEVTPLPALQNAVSIGSNKKWLKEPVLYQPLSISSFYPVATTKPVNRIELFYKADASMGWVVINDSNALLILNNYDQVLCQLNEPDLNIFNTDMFNYLIRDLNLKIISHANLNHSDEVVLTTGDDNEQIEVFERLFSGNYNDDILIHENGNVISYPRTPNLNYDEQINKRKDNHFLFL